MECHTIIITSIHTKVRILSNKINIFILRLQIIIFTALNGKQAIKTTTTFQSTKALLDTTINEIIESLESKRTELSHLIDDYESDYDTKQSETLSDLNQLEQLKKHTEGLAKNTLSDLQEKVIEDITLKISKLESRDPLS